MADKTQPAVTESVPAPVDKNSKDYKAAKSKLFKDYDAADVKARAAQKTLNDANAARSGLVERIFQLCGSGPFNFNGRIVTVMTRRLKDADGNPSDNVVYFFRGQSAEAEEV